MTKIVCWAAIASLAIMSAGAFAESAFSGCEVDKDNNAVVRTSFGGTERVIHFTGLDHCRTQMRKVSAQNLPVVLCGCRQALTGAQVLAAIFSGFTSMMAARQWHMRLECIEVGTDRINVVKEIDFGIYKSEPAAEDDPDGGYRAEVFSECRNQEMNLFDELNTEAHPGEY